ncbi:MULTISPECIES: hypothetical protein [Rhizobium]|uniref:Secreted protein n=1 Tax=Rhizobium favelukesii TaxID=348824 RepID=W6R8V1_9HYPH|nr:MULTISPECIES: hypothetical protein [Rhizobium]MCA0800982.1 hypothetical protein [Rhizobium sp. T1473]MCS0459053.1 hypothetical protein [Rhizobium favelukesii]UFS81458.1 hypothetical protein LPB79_24600 [Rhizobium sp. T136]CDM56835.1 hypothetical protein LPU83_1161 [Rhizobium favelukesii]
MLQLIAAALLACGCVSLAEVADWPPADSYVPKISCHESDAAERCAEIRAAWTGLYADAIAGRVESQRKVSFCLSTGCNKGIVVEPILGCAWRQVIAASRNPQINDADRANINRYCGPRALDDAGRKAARDQSQTWLTLLGVTP